MYNRPIPSLVFTRSFPTWDDILSQKWDKYCLPL